jgi:beta-mannosidase
MNMLRVWGGGVYSSEAFMAACDEMGILVWHDFMYACGYYPDHDPGFVENITTEARKAIRRLRRHVSLIGWAGSNEIQGMYHSQKQWHPDLPFYGKTIYEEILPKLVAELCSGLIYRESSPFGDAQEEGLWGDQHIWRLTHVHDHPHYLDLWRFTEFRVKFLSEFGIMGAMSLETAQRCIPAEHMHPADPVWLHHTTSCQDHTLLDRMKRQYFGDEAYSPQQYILRSQAAQAEITRHIYEEFRRQKFTCSGLLFWTLSDSYGVHNWSLIDYGMRRKPIYHALKRAQSPLALCVKGWDVQNDEGRLHWREHWQKEPGKLEIWGMNDTCAASAATLQWAMLSITGRVLLEGTQDVHLPENASVFLADVSLEGLAFDPAQNIFRARLVQNGRIVNETKYFFAPFAEMTAPDAEVDVQTRQISGDQYEVILTANRFVWMAHLREPDGTTYSDNDMDLWPGEPCRIVATTDDPHYTPLLVWMGKENDA